MLENVIEDLDVYSFRLGLLKLSCIFMVFLYPTIWPVIVYRYGYWCTHKCKIPIINQILFIFYFFIKRLSEILTGIEIGHSANIGKGLYVAHLGDCVIGNKAEIGDYCSIRNGCTIGGAGRKENYGHPIIGNCVYIGAGAKVIGKIKVGNNVMIGANAVVVKDVPDNAVVGGVPAKLISFEGSEDFVHYRIKRKR
ncbi:MAG: serine O-acetyltransferase [Candidatus Methanoperedens sp.]